MRMRGDGGREIDWKELGACGRDVLNESGKLLLRFVEDNNLALLEDLSSFQPCKNGVSYIPKRQPQQ